MRREIGEFHNRMPRIEMNLEGLDGDFPTEFILDTGFNGHLALPRRVLQRLNVRAWDATTHQVAGGEVIVTQTFTMEIVWLGRTRTVEVIALEGNPLLGTGLLLGTQITIDAVAGGEVMIETI